MFQHRERERGGVRGRERERGGGERHFFIHGINVGFFFLRLIDDSYVQHTAGRKASFVRQYSTQSPLQLYRGHTLAMWCAVWLPHSNNADRDGPMRFMLYLNLP